MHSLLKAFVRSSASKHGKCAQIRAFPGTGQCALGFALMHWMDTGKANALLAHPRTLSQIQCYHALYCCTKLQERGPSSRGLATMQIPVLALLTGALLVIYEVRSNDDTP